MALFEIALQETLGYEGDFSDHPLDRGGPTKWGITQRTYDSYRRTTGRTQQAVALMTVLEMQAIYREDYWEPCRCDDLPPGLARAVFDMAVHSGVSAAKRTLQRSLNVKVDGAIGPQTIAAALERGSVLSFLKRRAGYIQDVIRFHPGDVEFLEGWINRLLDQAWKSKP